MQCSDELCLNLQGTLAAAAEYGSAGSALMKAPFRKISSLTVFGEF